MNLQLLRQTLGPLELASGELEAFANATGRRPPVAIRVHPRMPRDQLPFATEPVAWHPQGAIVPPSVRPGRFVHFAAGDYYIQDAGSLLAIRLFERVPGRAICDLCAAPGGKSTALLEMLDPSVWLLVNETIRSRLPPLQLNLARHGSTRFVLSSLDPRHLAEQLPGQFDGVMVDAPCSGQSLLSRGKQTRSAFDPQTVAHCAARQDRILDAAEQLVCPGGRLVYSTCTYSYAENEGAVSRFLDRHADWQIDPEEALTDYESPVLPGSYRLWPHRHPTAGAFAVRLRRRAGEPVSQQQAGMGGARLARRRAARRNRSSLHKATIPHELETWGTIEFESIWSQGHHLIGWPDSPNRAWLHAARGGPQIATRHHRDWRPAYALAMRSGRDWTPQANLCLDDSQAIGYVTGSPVPCAQRGWIVATWNGRPLGWLKGDGTWGKNHLPKSARLTRGAI